MTNGPQDGEEVAADASTTAEEGDGAAEREALLERARTALAAGDEEACQDALEEAAAL